MVQAVMCCLVKNVLETDFHVSMHKVFAFGSDGASAMVGRNNSVTSRLKQVNQYLVNCHCVGHRCALSISQAADVVPQIRTYRDSLCAVYSFYANSSIRKKKLLDFQEIFDELSQQLAVCYEMEVGDYLLPILYFCHTNFSSLQNL